MKGKLTLTQRISFAAMLLAISFVLTIVAKTVNMGDFFFVRFSFAPGIVVASSLMLGPFFGGLIGIFTDLLPALVYPTGSINIFITFVYLLLGVCPYFFHKIFRKSPKWFFLFLPIIVFAIVEGGLAFLFYGTNLLDESFGESGKWAKIVILIGSCIVFCAIETILILLDKKKFSFLPSSIGMEEMVSISCFCELLIMVVLKSLAFFLYYEFLAGGENPFSFSFIFSMLMVGVIPDVLLMTFTSSFLLWLAERFMKVKPD